MSEHVPESPEGLQHALHNPNLQGWNETHDDQRFGGQTYWWLQSGDLYLGVLPKGFAAADYYWFVGQGRKGDPDLDPQELASGSVGTAEAAREAATTWYNRNRMNIKERP
jgi:hypothetical protein